jgi:hypothetical protein
MSMSMRRQVVALASLQHDTMVPLDAAEASVEHAVPVLAESTERVEDDHGLMELAASDC